MTEQMIKSSNQRTNLMKRNKRDSKRSRYYQEYQANCEAQSGHKPPRQAEQVGVIVPNDPDLTYLS